MSELSREQVEKRHKEIAHVLGSCSLEVDYVPSLHDEQWEQVHFLLAENAALRAKVEAYVKTNAELMDVYEAKVAALEAQREESLANEFRLAEQIKALEGVIVGKVDVSLHWSPTKPTVAGWYWFQEAGMNNGKHPEYIVEIQDIGGTLHQESHSRYFLLANASGQWAGPLEPPT